MRSLQFPVLVLALECYQQALRCRAEDEGTCPAGSPGCGLGEGVDDEDHYGDEAQCQAWARLCECQLNPQFMLMQCARSCRLYGGDCVDEGASCQRVTLEKKCTPDQWGACPKVCKLYREERKKIRRGEKQRPEGSTEAEEKTVRCVRRETPGGLQNTSVAAMFRRIEQSEWAKKYEPKVLSRDPWVIHLGKFLTEQQADGLRAVAEDGRFPWQASFELGLDAAARRKSETIFCTAPACFRDPRVLEVHAVATNVTGLALLNQEYMQILRYVGGDFYVEHQDTNDVLGASAAGHRVYTLFVYLSTVPRGFGGETSFPALGLKVPPKKGSAVLWSNVQTDRPREDERRSVHAALPVKSKNAQGEAGEFTKLGVNMWLYGYDWRSQYAKNCMNVDAGY